MSTSNSKYKFLTHCSPKSLMLIHKDEIHKGDLWNFLYLKNSTRGLSIYFRIKKILKQSPKINNFQKFQQSSTVFRCGMFYKVLQYSFGKFCNSREFQIILFLLDTSIYIIEQNTNLKYIKHQEKQISLTMSTIIELIILRNTSPPERKQSCKNETFFLFKIM